MSIDIEVIEKELRQSGTDDRLTRALLVLARHVDKALQDRDEQLEYRIDDRIDHYRDRDAYHRALEGS